MDHNLEAALSYGQRGWFVFPLFGIKDGACTCGRASCSSPGKHPRVRRGLHEATTDPKQIESWWAGWPQANIGVVTSTPSGFVVVDLDEPESDVSLARLEERGYHLSPTLTAITGSGRHLYYATDLALSNTTRRLPGVDEDLPGIDLRADGGYVVAPPSSHVSGTNYSWVDPGTPLAPLPNWIRPAERHSPTASMASAPTPDGDGTPYGLAVLREEVDNVSKAQVGTRNDQLNRSAFALAQIVAGGELAEALARTSLHEAAVIAGLEDDEITKTIASAFAAGTRDPRSAPHRIPKPEAT